MLKNIFEKLCKLLDLGELNNIEEIKVGITNKLFKMNTSKGSYAVKIINKDNIKKDNELLEKIEFSEHISDIANKNGVNSVTAIKFNNKYIQKLEEEHLLVYNWCSGCVKRTCDITLNDVKKIAKELGMLHSIKVNYDFLKVKYNKINFKIYYELLKKCNEEWCLFFKKNYTKLEKIYRLVYSSYQNVSSVQSYVHKDLNRKNILWLDNEPFIIDFETARVGNPYLDFFNSAWFLTADIQEDKFIAFYSEYKKYIKLDSDVKKLACAAIIDECNWLEYSLKRALKIHSNNEEEIRIGKESVTPSLNEIINYFKKIPRMCELINSINEN